MRSILLLSLALVLATLAAPALAEEQEAWAERLAAADQEIDDLEARVAELETAVTRAKRENYPRGDARAALQQDLDDSRAKLAEAREAFSKLVKEAHDAGVLPEVLRPYTP